VTAVVHIDPGTRVWQVAHIEELLTIRVPQGTRRRLEQHADAQSLTVRQLVLGSVPPSWEQFPRASNVRPRNSCAYFVSSKRVARTRPVGVTVAAENEELRDERAPAVIPTQLCRYVTIGTSASHSGAPWLYTFVQFCRTLVIE